MIRRIGYVIYGVFTLAAVCWGAAWFAQFGYITDIELMRRQGYSDDTVFSRVQERLGSRLTIKAPLTAKDRTDILNDIKADERSEISGKRVLPITKHTAVEWTFILGGTIGLWFVGWASRYILSGTTTL